MLKVLWNTKKYIYNKKKGIMNVNLGVIQRCTWKFHNIFTDPCIKFTNFKNKKYKLEKKKYDSCPFESNSKLF